jgi:hypothetical protein
MNAKLITLVLILNLFIVGCTHQAVVGSVSATNVYSGFDSKITGNTTYTVDDSSITKLIKNDTVSGFECSAHRYPIDATNAFNASVPSMLRAVFEVEPNRSSSPQKDAVHLVFSIERFEPRLKFIQKFFGADAEANVEVSINVTGSLNGKRVFGTSVDSQRNASGDAGDFCSSASDILADAARLSIKDVLEKTGERLSNSQSLRNLEHH